jgi:hypothetical protein
MAKEPWKTNDWFVSEWNFADQSRHAVHRGLRIPGLREGDDSPLRIWFHHAVLATCIPDGLKPGGSTLAA